MHASSRLYYTLDFYTSIPLYHIHLLEYILYTENMIAIMRMFSTDFDHYNH